MLNTTVRVNDFQNLSNYGVVVIASHGDTVDVVAKGNYKKTISENYPIILTRELFSDTHLYEVLSKDIGYEGRIVKVPTKNYGNVAAVTPAYISDYNKGAPNSIVQISSCRSLYNMQLAKAFLDAGFAVVSGYTEYVENNYAGERPDELFKLMIEGKTFKEAFAEATKDGKAHDTNNPPAYFKYVMRSDVSDVTLENVGIQNGSFEEDLNFWNGEGDTRAIAGLAGQIAPQDGKFMCVISSGFGFMPQQESTIAQQFKIPNDAQQLTFRYDFVSEEPMEWVGTIYNDVFEANLIDAEGNKESLVYKDINTTEWSLQLDGDVFYGGDDTAFHTGWQTVTYDIPETMRGKYVTLRFNIWDEGDAIFDTAALIDSVKILP
jgi:hypothetical protein